jgi:prepilin-type N-terminal cleavage/methylation domain-containing protein
MSGDEEVSMRRLHRGFTIVEMLVVIAVISLLMGLLLPAINKARNTAKVTASQSNLRQLGTAHANYGSEWSDRQFTLVPDDMATYGSSPDAAVAEYFSRRGKYPPPILLGWTEDPPGTKKMWPVRFSVETNQRYLSPIEFAAGGGLGWFRIPNARQFSQYLNGRFYDPIFYAPKDEIVMDYVQPLIESPWEFVPTTSPNAQGRMNIGWSSYCLSPAALFNPSVMRAPEQGGWQDPWTVGAGFRAPSYGQAQYSALKTHMIEHHWLQNRQARCNTQIGLGWYDGCDPYYFNQSAQSAPVSLFYDGHVQLVGVRQAIESDARVLTQNGSSINGLWSRDTAMGVDGYYSDLVYGGAQTPERTNFHILTTDGIKGRDILGDR